jgi:hypothetical protein
MNNKKSGDIFFVIKALVNEVIRELYCITGEKWFASGEAIFHRSRYPPTAKGADYWKQA